MIGEWPYKLVALVQVLIFTGCATTGDLPPDLDHIDNSNIPPADITLSVSGLGPCTNNPDRTLNLNSTQPVIMLVHGCLASAGRFRSLAQVFAFHGQQSVCFSYNDRESLTSSATQLVTALDELASHMKNPQVTVIGHSQGGLIARNAFTTERVQPLVAELDLRLVTISSPFAGISAADHCGSPVARVATLGLVAPICMLISGDKWHEITAYSKFINDPGNLIRQVNEFIKIVTDERDSCRLYDSQGNCTEDDYVFSIEEQYYYAIDNSPKVVPVEVIAGHAEIVGNDSTSPEKLIAILQDHNIMRTTPVSLTAALDSLLGRLYKVDSYLP
jgi:pimeloyl-ACP methyl ester carboxylesterase